MAIAGSEMAVACQQRGRRRAQHHGNSVLHLLFAPSDDLPAADVLARSQPHPRCKVLLVPKATHVRTNLRNDRECGHYTDAVDGRSKVDILRFAMSYSSSDLRPGLGLRKELQTL